MTTMTARLLARTRGAHLDALLATGARPEPGTPLAARADRLRRRRPELGREWCAVRDRARRPPSVVVSNRVPIATRQVVDADDLVLDLVAWLWGPRPVSVRGLASARLLLTDGRGPLYGRGALRPALRHVLAMLG